MLSFRRLTSLQAVCRIPTPRVKDFKAPDSFDASHSNGAATIVFSAKHALSGPQLAKVHYFQPEPIVSYKHYLRRVQASHWRNVVAVHEEVELINSGPK